jgi:ribosomal protein S18 acetylase RimI-like enzyme
MRIQHSAHPADLHALLDFVRAVRPRGQVAEYPGLADLPELLGQPRIRRRTALWFDDSGALTGYALVDPGNNLVFETRPDVKDVLDGEILSWGLTCAAWEGLTALDAFARSRDAGKAARLVSLGFVPLPDRTLHFVRPLGQPIPSPILPEGFSIRPSGGEPEAAAWVRLHRAAFGSRQMTLAGRLSMLRAPEYDPALDLVAVAPNGRLAAYCVGTISAAENALTGVLSGHTDPIATHPKYQRHGLSIALILTALGLLRERGMQLARLGTSGANLAMQATARRAGFEVEDETCWFTRAC